jgi:hypothetical protein
MIVFVHVRPATQPVYDGYTAWDEVQFPLHCAQLANSYTAQLRDKFVHMFLARYHMMCAARSDAKLIERFPKPDYATIVSFLTKSEQDFKKLVTSKFFDK